MSCLGIVTVVDELTKLLLLWFLLKSNSRALGYLVGLRRAHFNRETEPEPLPAPSPSELGFLLRRSIEAKAPYLRDVG